MPKTTASTSGSAGPSLSRMRDAYQQSLGQWASSVLHHRRTGFDGAMILPAPTQGLQTWWNAAAREFLDE
ncbi:MAG: hypothetical protein IT440_10690 [Phycisphaeraceae bacterium]|nr:hypothetical protein [Phycisphaeraceae bacterium]